MRRTRLRLNLGRQPSLLRGGLVHRDQRRRENRVREDLGLTEKGKTNGGGVEEMTMRRGSETIDGDGISTGPQQQRFHWDKEYAAMIGRG